MPNQKSSDTLVFGCGYLGICVARKLKSVGIRVWGVTRSETRASLLKGQGIFPIVADWTDRRTLCQLPNVGRILIAVSHDRDSRYDRYESKVAGLRNLLQQTSPEANLCYVSTTGVYHQTDGSWVDEASTCRPTRPGGQAHFAAEAFLHRVRPGRPGTILRLAGVYGPGRIPRVADVLAGRPIASPQNGFLNLIHVDDAADAVISTWSNSQRRLYVVSDDRPIVRREFYREIAKRYGAPEPQFVNPPTDAPVKMRSSSNKRIWNRKMKRDLVPKLRYPTFIEGIDATLTT